MSDSISNTVDATLDSHLEREAPIPRLSIAMLMLWMTLSGLGIVASNWSLSRLLEGNTQTDASTRQMLSAAKISGSLSAATFAAALVGLGALVYAKSKGGRLLRHPGHWIIGIQCLAFIAGVAMYPVTSFQSHIHNSYDWSLTGWKLQSYLFFGISTLLTTIIPVALNVVAARYHQSWWRTAFFAFAAVQALTRCIPWVWNSVAAISPSNAAWFVAYQLPPIISAIAILVPLSHDFTRNTKRDWVHWVGAIVVLMACPIVIAQIVLATILT